MDDFGSSPNQFWDSDKDADPPQMFSSNSFMSTAVGDIVDNVVVRGSKMVRLSLSQLNASSSQNSLPSWHFSSKESNTPPLAVQKRTSSLSLARPSQAVAVGQKSVEEPGKLKLVSEKYRQTIREKEKEIENLKREKWQMEQKYSAIIQEKDTEIKDLRSENYKAVQQVQTTSWQLEDTRRQNPEVDNIARKSLPEIPAKLKTPARSARKQSPAGGTLLKGAKVVRKRKSKSQESHEADEGTGVSAKPAVARNSVDDENPPTIELAVSLEGTHLDTNNPEPKKRRGRAKKKPENDG